MKMKEYDKLALENTTRIDMLKRLYSIEYNKVKEILLEIRKLKENYAIGIHHTTKYAIDDILNNGLKIYRKSYETDDGKIILENNIEQLGTTKSQVFSKENISDEDYLEFIDRVFSAICTDTIYGSSSILTITPLKGQILIGAYYEKEVPYKILPREFFILATKVDKNFSSSQAEIRIKECMIPDFQQNAQEKLNNMRISQLTELKNFITNTSGEEDKRLH